MVADPSVVVGGELEVAVAAFAYEGAMRRILSRFKYGGASRLARPLAEAAGPILSKVSSVASADVYLVPVPIHPDRLRRRGYNQAALLATHLGRVFARPVEEVLARQRPTMQQHRLNRAQRLRNLRQAFAPGSGARSPRSVILVDDILTTSATLEACAAVLRSAGAEQVVGVAIARDL